MGIFKLPSINSTDRVTSIWDQRELMYDIDLDKIYKGDGATLGGVVVDGAGASDGFNIIYAGTQLAGTANTVTFANSNGISFGMDTNTITASYTVPATTQLQLTANMSNYLGTSYTSHTHSQYVNTSQSSLFQNTSLMSNYLGTSYTSHTHSEYIETSQSTLFQHTSLMTDYLGTNYTSHTHSEYINTSQSTLFQHTSLMADYLGTNYTSHTHSQYVNTSNSSLLQHTSLMSDYLGTGYTTHTHSQYVNTSASSLFQQTSLMTDYLGTGYTTHTHTQLNQAASASNGSSSFQTLSLGNSNGFSFYFTNGSVVGSYTVPSVTEYQYSSLMTDYLGTSYTTHTHSQSVQTQNMVSIMGSTGDIFFENGNGVTFGANASTITASYTVPATTHLLQNSQSTLFQHTSAMSDYLGTGYTTHTHSQYLTTQTVQTQNLVSVQGSVGQISFSNSNGITFGGNASTITASYTVPATTHLQQTSLMSDYLGTGYTTHTHSQYINTSVSSNFLTSQSNQAFSASGGSSAFQTLSFANSNGLTFSNSNGSVIGSYTVPATTHLLQTSQSSLFQQTSLMSNYLGTSYTTHTHAAQPVAVSGSNGSFNFSTLSFGNLNGMSFYTSNGSIVASYTDGGGGGGGIVLANSQTTYTSGTAHLAALGAMTIQSTTGQSYQFSVPQTSSLSATGQVSISTNGSTISIGVPTPVTLNYFNPQDGYVQVVGQQGNASMHIQPMQAPNVQFDRIAIPLNFTNATNTTGSATMSMSIGFFTNNASTLSLVSSTSYSAAVTYSGTINNSTFAGIRLHTVPFTGTFLESQYYVGIWSRTTTGGANATLNQVLASQMNSSYSGLYGVSSHTSMQYTRGLGHYSVTFSTAMPGAVPFTGIRGVSSIVLRQPLFYLVNGTV